MEVATAVCNELHYDSNGKHYFGIGFPNSAGGYEIRNPFFKGCIAPKNISVFYANEPKKICFLFEGFMDFFVFYYTKKIEESAADRTKPTRLHSPQFCIKYS